MTGLVRRLCFTAAALSLAIAAPAFGRSEPRFYILGAASGPAISDGIRDVAFPRTDYASIAFYDFGDSAPYSLVLPRASCLDARSGETSRGNLTAVGSGRLGWNCDTTLAQLLIQDLGSDAGYPPADPNHTGLGDADSATPSAFGTRWMSVLLAGYHYSDAPAYYNLATGAWQPELRSAREYPNLDDPVLAQTMCAPLRRRIAPNGDPYNSGPEYEPYFYDPPFGVGVVSRKSNRYSVARITLQRCGSRHLSTIARCVQSCGDVDYSSGLVTWVDARALHAYAPRTRHYYAWRLTQFRPALTAASLTHTKQRVIASIPPVQGGTEWSIWAARAPR